MLEALRAAQSNAVTFPRGFPIESAINAIRAAFGAYAAFLGATTARSGFVSVDDDATVIDAGATGPDVAGQPLWPNGSPSWASDSWRQLKTALLGAGEGWKVWIDWYEARLAGDGGRPPDEALEIARATIADEIWKQGPTVVNAEIKRLIAEHSPPGTRDAGAIDGATQDQPDFEPILATRAALRVLPLLAADTDRIGDADKSRFALSVFHALATAWARTEFSALVDPEWCVAAARNVSAYAEPSALSPRLVGNAAAEAAFSAGSESPRVAGSRTSVALARAKGAVAAMSRDAALAVIIEEANASDKADIVPGVRPDQLGQIELWSGRDPPALIGQHWDNLKEQLRFANEGWDVWIDWYEARLDGRIRSQEVELAYVNYTKNVLSTASAWEANSEIKRLIELANPNLIVPTGTLTLTAGTPSFAVGDNLSGSVTTSAPPPADPPPIESIPEQERTGTRFGMDAQGRIDVLQTPPTIDQLQRFHYEEMRHKAEALAGLGQMLGDITPAIARTLEALPAHIERASVDRLWSRANTLRRRHDAHVRAIDHNLGPDPARLHPLVAASLGDFIDSFNVFVIGDPRGLELDRIQLGPKDREATRKIVTLAAPIARALTEPHSPTNGRARDADRTSRRRD